MICVSTPALVCKEYKEYKLQLFWCVQIGHDVWCSAVRIGSVTSRQGSHTIVMESIPVRMSDLVVNFQGWSYFKKTW